MTREMEMEVKEGKKLGQRKGNLPRIMTCESLFLDHPISLWL